MKEKDLGMPKRHKEASKPITKDEDIDISDSQKRHYAKMGYRPYLSNGGKIKWLSFEQHIYEKIKYAKRNSLFSIKRIHSKKTRPGKYLKSIIRLLIDNWFLLVIMTGIVLALIYINQILKFLSGL